MDRSSQLHRVVRTCFFFVARPAEGWVAEVEPGHDAAESAEEEADGRAAGIRAQRDEL